MSSLPVSRLAASALHVGVRSVARRCMAHRFYCSIVQSPYPDITVPDVTLPEFIWKGVNKWGDQICVECGVTGRSYTYTQARDCGNRFAVWLRKQGLGHEDVLAVALPNIPEYPLVVLGALEAGLIITTINPAYTSVEISDQLTNSHTTCVVVDVHHYKTVVEAMHISKKSHIHVIVAGSKDVPRGATNFHQLIECGENVSVIHQDKTNLDSLAVLPYSSGTTGLPKGVMLSHRNLIANLLQLGAEHINLNITASDEHQDVVPALLPFYHIYGLTVLMFDKLAHGSKIVTLPRFEPTTFFSAIADYKASLLYVAPPLVLFMGYHPAVRPQLLQSVRYIVSGAAPLAANDIHCLLGKCPQGLEVLQGYGMTETSPCIMHLRKGSSSLTAVGPPVSSTSAKVVDLSTGACLGPGQKGEVCVRGPQVMIGYLNNPQATASMIDSDGWLHTGDVGHYDEDLDFYITDRVKELIKVKGMQVPPAELEEVLRTHPKVLDVAVIGIPCKRSGEVPQAFVVLRDGASVTEMEIKDFVASRVASYKHLVGGVKFVSKIPKSPAGKILRRQLKHQSNQGMS